ncbi:MAG TPA: nitroreductase family protein [bacterium]
MEKGLTPQITPFNLNEVERLLKTRRSVRLYKKDDVADDVIKKIVDLAHWAPSGMNAQPWRFVIIKDKNLIEEIRKVTVKWMELLMKIFTKKGLHWKLMKFLYKIFAPGMFATIEPRVLQGMRGLTEIKNTDVLLKAPVLIIILGNKRSNTWLEDCSAATQNLALAAHAMGLGSCWIGFAEKLIPFAPGLKKKLGIKSPLVLATVSTLGYPIVDYGRKIIERDDPEVVWMK